MAIWSGETTGQRIERLREGCGLTQFELGERVDLSEHVIYRIEKDRVRIENSRDMLERLAVVLGVSADYILRGETSAERQTMALIDDKLMRGECTAEQAERLKEMGTAEMRRRSNVRVPLSHFEIDVMLEAVRERRPR